MGAPQFDPRLDLRVERIVDVPPDLAWAAWTVPEHVKKWFCPLPWKAVECEIISVASSRFVPNRKIVWTVALQPGFRPLDTVIWCALRRCVIQDLWQVASEQIERLLIRSAVNRSRRQVFSPPIRFV